MLIKLLLGVLHIAALSLFALKYLRFDVKSTIQSDTLSPQNEALINEVEKQLNDVNVTDGDAKFDRFVFFLLDAWRWDFLFSEGTEMNFLKGYKIR